MVALTWSLSEGMSVQHYSQHILLEGTAAGIRTCVQPQLGQEPSVLFISATSQEQLLPEEGLIIRKSYSIIIVFKPQCKSQDHSQDPVQMGKRGLTQQRNDTFINLFICTWIPRVEGQWSEQI